MNVIQFKDFSDRFEHVEEKFLRMRLRIVAARRKQKYTIEEFAALIEWPAEMWQNFELGLYDNDPEYFIYAAQGPLGLHGKLLLEGAIPEKRVTPKK